MVKCAFSGDEIPKGTGKMFVKDSGQVLWFKNSKCEKNYLKLNRDPRKFKWTASYVKGEVPVANDKKKAAKKETKKADTKKVDKKATESKK